jgi:exopolysaccharide biosynthesis polyprenyl glycosylphosphotransferase
VRANLFREDDPRRSFALRRLLVVSDAVAIAVSWVIVSIAGPAVRYPSSRPGTLAIAIALATFGAVLARHWGLYLARVHIVGVTELATLARMSVVVAFAGVITERSFGADRRSLAVPLVVVVCFLLLVAGRVVIDAWIKTQRRNGVSCRRLVLVGDGRLVEELEEMVAEWPDLGYRVVGYVGPSTNGEAPGLRTSWIGNYDHLVEAVHESDATAVFIAGRALAEPTVMRSALELAQERVNVEIAPGFGTIDHRRLRATSVGYEPVLSLEPRSLRPWSLHAKRVVDVTLAAFALLLTAPLLLLAALAIKLGDRGPVLFRQERVGLLGRRFQLLKLRTMQTDAEARLDDLAERNQRSGPLFKMTSDPRVTRVGRILRATSLDELPQLLNVIRGEMSLVGPRPPLTSEFDQFDEELRHRHDQLPGITGLWQLEARDNPSFSTYRRLDLFYVRNWSLTLDLVILLLTVFAVGVRAISEIAGAFSLPKQRRSPRRRAIFAGCAIMIVASGALFVQAMARAAVFSGLGGETASAATVPLPPPTPAEAQDGASSGGVDVGDRSSSLQGPDLVVSAVHPSGDAVDSALDPKSIHSGAASASRPSMWLSTAKTSGGLPFASSPSAMTAPGDSASDEASLPRRIESESRKEKDDRADRVKVVEPHGPPPRPDPVVPVAGPASVLPPPPPIPPPTVAAPSLPLPLVPSVLPTPIPIPTSAPAATA